MWPAGVQPAALRSSQAQAGVASTCGLGAWILASVAAARAGPPPHSVVPVKGHGQSYAGMRSQDQPRLPLRPPVHYRRTILWWFIHANMPNRGDRVQYGFQYCQATLIQQSDL